MNPIKAKRALRNVVKMYGISEREVVTEIEYAISETLETVRRENDVTAMEKWRKIPCKGEIPNAYELVAYLSEEVEKKYDQEEGIFHNS